MSDAIKVSYRYAKESTYGLAPGGTYKEIRLYGEDVKLNQQYLESDEFRTDGNIPSVDRVNANVGGTIKSRLSYATFDDWFEYVLRADSTWAGASTVSATSVASSDSSFNSSAAFNSVTHAAGKFFVTSGWSNAANNGIFLITSFSSTSKIIVVGATAVVNETATKNVVAMDSMTNGTTLPSMSLEKAFTDVASTFHLFGGDCLGGVEISVSPKKWIDVVWNHMAQDLTLNSATDSSSVTAANTNGIFQGLDHVLWMAENQTAILLSEFSVKIDNNLRFRDDQLATLGPVSMGQGDFKVTGKLRAYFGTNYKTLFAKFPNNTLTNLAIAMRDSNSHGYAIYLPNVRITAASPPASAKNTDIMLDLDYQAFYDSTKGYTMRLARTT